MFCPERFGLIEASTKSGKTVSAIAWLIELAMAGKPGQNFWWVAPGYNQAEIAYRRIKQGLTKGSFVAYDTPTPRIQLMSGTTLWFKSADNADCFDDQTEILTTEGWKFFQELDKSEQVLTLNPSTLVAEWQYPKRYIAEPYTGLMYSVNSGKLDLLVTPNHRFFVKTQSGGTGGGRPRDKLIAERALREPSNGYKFKKITEINPSNDIIPASVGWVGRDLSDITEDVCALFGIYLSEGCAAGNSGGTTALANSDYTVHFTQKEGIKGGVKGNAREQMRALFARLGLTSTKETEDGFFIRSKELWRIFSLLGNCYSKSLPPVIRNLPPNKLDKLLHWLLLGDGTIRYSSSNTETLQKVYYTTSKLLADDVQEIAIKAGYSATIGLKQQAVSVLADGRAIVAKEPLYAVSILHSQFNYFADSAESYISQQLYAGMVYCVETENSTVMVRRNGKVCWSGNSLYGEDVFAGVIDEASRVSADSWHAVRSTLTATRGPIRIIGNVKGRKNWFYDLARRAESGTAPNMHYAKITADDAVQAGVLDAEEIEDARQTLPEFIFRELYYAEPGDDAGNPFGLDHISACTREGLAPGPVVAWGIDLAKSHDYLVCIGLNDSGGVAAFHRWRGLPWRRSIQAIWKLVGEDTPALVDSTGVGDPVLEELQFEHGNFMGYHFSPASKQKLMEGLSVSIQSREITFPKGQIKLELELFEYEEGRTGVRYSAPEGQFDDCVCALALARQMWTEVEPGANVIKFYAQTAAKAQQAPAEVVESNRPWRKEGADPTGTLDNELTELYNEMVQKVLPSRRRVCVHCGEPVIGPTTISDGELFWHPACAGTRPGVPRYLPPPHGAAAP